VVRRFHHGRREFFGGEAIAPTDDGRQSLQLAIAVVQPFLDGVHNVEVERFACGARFLRAIKHGNLPYSRRKRFEEVLQGEWTIEANLQEADLLARSIEVRR